MTIQLPIKCRGRNITVTIEVFNIDIALPEPDIGFTGAIDDFEIDEIYVNATKGLKVPSSCLDLELYSLLMSTYREDIENSIIKSLEEY